MAASALDDDQMMAIFDLTKKGFPVIAHGKSTRAKILSLGFNTASNTIIATCVKEVSFFTFQNGKIKGSKGIGWGKTAAESVLCQASVGQTTFTGGYGGDIISWSGKNLGKRTKAHAGRVNALFAQGNTLVSGGHDGKVNVYAVNGATLKLSQTLDLNDPSIQSSNAKATSVCIGPNNKILVGTRGGEIVEFTGNSSTVYMRSHFESELWGLALHPNKTEMITYGRDGMLAIWDMVNRRQKIHTQLEGPGDAVAITNDGTKIAVGMINGTFQVFDYKTDSKGGITFKNIKARKDRSPKGKAIQIIKFSPND
jgi:WD40 repeat protein